jgi:acetyl-CoA acetyltransferase
MTRRAAITGVGYSELLGRNTGATEGELALQACRAAISDAGLSSADIDGLAMFPYRSTPPRPFDGPGLPYVQRSLGINALKWNQSYSLENGQLGPVIGAIDALGAGRCSHVVCYRAHLAQERRYLAGGADPSRAYDEAEHIMPYGAGSGTARGALWAARYMHVNGVSQRELGSVSVNGRAYAAKNPRAYWRSPVTIDEYLESRWISTPLKLLDCDYPIDGAVAFVVSRADVTPGTRRPVWIEASGTGPGGVASWLEWRDKAQMGSESAASQLWSGTSLRPQDVDVAEMYDGFSFFTLLWLESLGLAARGRAGRWLLEGGGQPGGTLAVNTDGGQLGMGRLHGFGKVAQATQQLRGEAVNQVPGASVAVAAVGGGPYTAALLLTNEVAR